MKGGYTGKILNVDLTTGKISQQDLPEEKVLRHWIGNWGLGLRMLYDMTPPGVRAVDPENPMIVLDAPLTGVNLPGCNQLSLATKNFNNDFVSSSASLLVPSSSKSISAASASSLVSFSKRISTR